MRNTHTAMPSKETAENTDLEFGVAVRTGISDFNVTGIKVVFEAMRTKLEIN